MNKFFTYTLKVIFIVALSMQNLFSEESFIPEPPSINAEYYLLKDAVSGRILAEQGADERVEPASITKVMTGYVVADQIDKGFISGDEEVLISEDCWRRGGSKMFIKEGTRVLVSDLIKGMVIQSGNDASCALAEHTAGSEEGFVDLMTRAWDTDAGTRPTMKEISRDLSQMLTQLEIGERITVTLRNQPPTF